MIIYEADDATVLCGIFRGVRVKFHKVGRTMKATPWLKHHLVTVHNEMKSLGFDTMTDDAAKAAYWDYFIDLFGSPPNGLHHRAVASAPVSDAVDQILSEFESHGRPTFSLRP